MLVSGMDKPCSGLLFCKIEMIFLTQLGETDLRIRKNCITCVNIPLNHCLCWHTIVCVSIPLYHCLCWHTIVCVDMPLFALTYHYTIVHQETSDRPQESDDGYVNNDFWPGTKMHQGVRLESYPFFIHWHDWWILRKMTYDTNKERIIEYDWEFTPLCTDLIMTDCDIW